MQTQTLVSTKYQVVIPKEVRRELKVKPGQKMDVEIVGEKIVLSKAVSKKQLSWPHDYIKKLGGIWKTSDDIENYLEEEDKSWE